MNKEQCSDCGKMVNANKFLFGSLHVCVPTQIHMNTQRGRNRSLEILKYKFISEAEKFNSKMDKECHECFMRWYTKHK